MKLLVPYIGALQETDAKLVRLAEFLGIKCNTLALANGGEQAEFLRKSVPEQCSCLIVNPRVMKEWVGLDGMPPDLVAFIVSRFTHVLVYGLRVDAFDTEMVAALSRGRLKSVHGIEEESPAYEVAENSRDICGAFSGLSFGPANSANDHVFAVGGSDPALRKLISIGGQPFMAAIRMEGTKILFVASEDVADLDAEVGDVPMAEYFSRLVPQAMALRYAAGEECWRPGKSHASIIIDDPLLRKRYGFLKFDSLLRLADQYRFHTAIAFIPHNFRRNTSRIARLFKLNAAQLSICFHGNDHTDAEFASTDAAFLNTLLHVAEGRMDRHRQATGLPCDRVMVFPQGNFSIQAMKVLKARNFYAAVNTVPYPAGQPVRLRIAEVAQPAVLRYGRFPLFLRNPSWHFQNHDIAFNLFFGRPILIVEHHEVFQHPESLVEIAAKINSVAADTEWANLATIVSNSFLTRRAADGTYHVRAYSSTIRLSNDSDQIRRYSVAWEDDACDGNSIEKVLIDGTPLPEAATDDTGILLSVQLAPRSSRTVSVVHRDVHGAPGHLSLRWKTRAFLRRRLSEMRDNYLSKNRHILKVATALQRRFLM